MQSKSWTIILIFRAVILYNAGLEPTILHLLRTAHINFSQSRTIHFNGNPLI